MSTSSSSASPSSSSSERSSDTSLLVIALNDRLVDGRRCQIFNHVYPPVGNTHNQEVPEEVQELKQKQRRKDLIFHPPVKVGSIGPYPYFR